jgi:type IV pilus assembly protein PilE
MKFCAQHQRGLSRKTAGFTLIELMIVVAVIGILAAIVYPSYQAYVRRANRSAVEQLMMKIASKEEQYLLDARAYTATLTGTPSLNLGTTEDTYTCTATQCTNTRYTVAVTFSAGPPPSYTITATAVGPQAVDTAKTLTLDNLGTKKYTDQSNNLLDGWPAR